MVGPFGWIRDEEGRPINVDSLTHIVPHSKLIPSTGERVGVASGWWGNQLCIIADSQILYDAVFPAFDVVAAPEPVPAEIKPNSDIGFSPDGQDHLQSAPDQNPQG